MRADKTIGFVFAIMAGLAVITSSVEAQTVEFVVKPERCITLHQGQTCYQNLQLNWRTPSSGEYCLVALGELLNGTPTVIVCWSGDGKASHRLEFVSDNNIIYQIRLRDQESALAQVIVEVAWVYKSGRTNFSHWRLF